MIEAEETEALRMEEEAIQKLSLPHSYHRCDIFSKGVVLPGRNDTDMDCWILQIRYTLWRITAII